LLAGELYIYVQIEDADGVSQLTDEDSRALAEEHGLTGPVLADWEYTLSQHFVFEDDLGKLEIPQITFVDPDGTVVATEDPRDLEGWID
jgi:hypothetical protein